MNKKIVAAIVVLVLAVAGWFGWKWLRFQVLFTMKLQAMQEKQIGRFPSSETVIAIPDMVKEAAQQAHVPTADMHTEIKLVGRDAGPVRFYYLHLHIEGDGGKSTDVEQRIESQAQLLNDAENLEAHGVKIEK